MLKIFMTGDNHIGMKYASHEKAEILSEARISAFEGMVRTANEEGCSLFVITGDLFDNTYGIPKKTIKRLLDMLSLFKGTVAVLPGNHDYYDRDSKLWKDFTDEMKAADNIMLLCEFRPYSLSVDGENITLFPAPCNSLHSAPNKNNLDWIKQTAICADGAYHIGIAHGAVEGETIDSEGFYFMMRRSELEEIPMDAWLIGHTHVPFPDLKEDSYTSGMRIFNAGTHVQKDVSCNTEGYCFVIEISQDKSVRAKKVKSGNLRYNHMDIALTAGEAEKIIDRELEKLSSDSVLDITFSGAVSAEEYENRRIIIEKRLERFIESNYNDSLTRLISKELIEKEFPETSFSAQLLKDLLCEPKEAQLLYDLLKSLKEGK